MAHRYYPGYETSYETSQSRRERREVREEQHRQERRKKWAGRARTMSRMLIGSSKKAAALQSFQEETRELEVPKSRRERRERKDKRGRQGRVGKWRGGVAELLFTVIVAFVLVFGVVRPFVVAAYKIPSESMLPALEVGDRILANKLVYLFSRPERGDIAVFQSVEDEEQTLIKRVVGVRRDKVQVRQGTLYVNDVAQEEPYLNEQMSRVNYAPIRIPKGYVFVMGDNRNNSADSRVFGPLPLENVEGKAFARFWPLPKIGALGTTSDTEETSN